ncbi:hypothetical protein PHMEG_000748 [Phytophthora megakarya]|uniref:Serine protease n=1 Tax=Phytophthora megakarya TaxID=4795 RepID=A0A225X4S2_9STRA|nr:hypothetical protein PHMEG_000748 [Phytophthora megakarya]
MRSTSKILSCRPFHADTSPPKTATSSNQAIVLLLNGKLDSQTPNKYAEILFKISMARKSSFSSFDYALHAIIATMSMVTGDISKQTCGIEVLVFD